MSDLKIELDCPICMETYNNINDIVIPRFCDHAVCSLCYESMNKSKTKYLKQDGDPDEYKNFHNKCCKCPMCRKPFMNRKEFIKQRTPANRHVAVRGGIRGVPRVRETPILKPELLENPHMSFGFNHTRIKCMTQICVTRGATQRRCPHHRGVPCCRRCYFCFICVACYTLKCIR